MTIRTIATRFILGLGCIAGVALASPGHGVAFAAGHGVHLNGWSGKGITASTIKRGSAQPNGHTWFSTPDSMTWTEHQPARRGWTGTSKLTEQCWKSVTPGARMRASVTTRGYSQGIISTPLKLGVKWV